MNAAAAVASMVLVAVAAASFGAGFFSEPYIQEAILEHSDQLWDNAMFRRITEMVRLI